MSGQIKIQVPATNANLGPGFDCIGLAVDLCNDVILQPADEGVCVTVEGEGAGQVDPTDNLLVYAYRKAFQFLNTPPVPVCMHSINRIPFARGLGSSSAAIVAGLCAAQVMSNHQMSEADVLALAVEMDGHPDNVLPALLGGVVIGAQGLSKPLAIHRIAPPEGLLATVLVPNYELETVKARQSLPEAYSREDCVFNIGHMGLLVAAFMSGDLPLLKDAMQDRIHEPYRLSLMPGMAEAREAAMEMGALAAVVSGAGSAMLFLSEMALDTEKLITGLKNQGYSGWATSLALRTDGATLYENERKLRLWP